MLHLIFNNLGGDLSMCDKENEDNQDDSTDSGPPPAGSTDTGKPPGG